MIHPTPQFKSRTKHERHKSFNHNRFQNSYRRLTGHYWAKDAMYVDAMAMDLVRRPGDYSVIVTSNLFGDIVSDLAAQLTGGLGLAPSANVHPGRHALFEPVHGSAPDIAGTGRANPLGAIRCAALLLEHLGHGGAAARVEQAVAGSIAQGRTTQDLGGAHSTEDVGRWIADAVGAAVPSGD